MLLKDASNRNVISSSTAISTVLQRERHWCWQQCLHDKGRWTQTSHRQNSKGGLGSPAGISVLLHEAGLGQRTVLTPPSRKLQCSLCPLDKPRAGESRGPAWMVNASLPGSDLPGPCPRDMPAEPRTGHVPQGRDSKHGLLPHRCEQLVLGLLVQQHLQSTTGIGPGSR